MKIYFLSLVLCLVSLACFADSKEQTPPPTGKEIVLLPANPPVNRPGVPGITIHCYYGEGFIQLIIPNGFYSFTVNIYNDNDSYQGLVTADNSVMEIPDLEGTYHLTCTADNGKVFSGTLEFE